MPTIAEAIAANNQRLASASNSDPSVPNPIPEAPLTSAPTPPSDLAAGLGLPQRGMFSASLVLSSDRSDSSRAFRNAGMRSATFPFPPPPTNTKTITNTVTTQVINTVTPSTSPSSNTPSGPGNEVVATPDGMAGPSGLRALTFNDFPISGVTPGSYTNTDLTVNAQGIITSAANGTSSGGVVSINTLTGVLTITAGTGITVVSSGTNIQISATATSEFNQSMLVDGVDMSDDYWISVDSGTYDQALPLVVM